MEKIKLRISYETGNIASESLFAEKVSEDIAIIITEPLCTSRVVEGSLVRFEGERIVEILSE